MYRRGMGPKICPVLLILAAVLVSPVRAQDNLAPLEEVRTLTPEDARFPTLPFPPGAGTELVLNPARPGGPTLDFRAHGVGRGRGRPDFSLPVSDPLNLTFDMRAGRLLVLERSPANLLEVRKGRGSRLNPNAIGRTDVRPLRVRDPRGLALDPATGHLFILDGAGPLIVEVEPDPSGRFDPGHAPPEGSRLFEIDLAGAGLVDAEGLAFDPSTGHLHVLSIANQRLYELTTSGEVVAVRDTSPFALNNLVAMVFGPSLDRTDDPFRTSLYVVTGVGRSATMTEFSLAGP